MDNYNRYIIDMVLQSRIDSANGSTGSSSVEEPSANLQSSSDGSGWTIDKTYADLQALQAKGTLTSLAWHREDGTIVTVPLTSTGPVDGKDAFVFSTILTTADGSTFNAFILDEDDVLTYVSEDIGGGGGGGVDTAFKVVGLKDGHPDVTSPSKKIIYLTKESGSTATDPYTEWIYTTDNEWAIIGETSVDLSGYKTKQTAKTDPTASGTKSAFIATITQNENGEITATKANLPQASTTDAGIVQLGSGATNAAPGNHTHTTEIASDSGSPTVNLEADTTYKLTAGGTSVVFKTPSAGAAADEKVKATAKSDNVAYPLMAVASSSPTSGDATEAVYGASVTLNPSTNTIAANISGDAATASDAKAGSTLATTIGGKANKVTGATDGELAMLDSSGDLKKSDISFDGTTTTKFLSKKGTFEDVSADVSGKADKVSNATEGDIATLDSTGNLVDSGVSTSDFATSAQGTKADSAIQGVSAGGTPLTPDANKVVNIPNAVATGESGATDGLMTAADKKKLSDMTVITVTETSVTDGTTTFNKYVHPTTAGNKHVPAGGAEHNILCWSADGTATWDSDEYEDVDIVTPTIDSVTIAGKTYPVVKIGNRYWMAENLDMPLPNTSIGSDAFNPSQNWYVDYPSYVYYSYYKAGSVSYYSRAGGTAPPVEGHGLLYNWNAAKYISDNAETLLPDGWRVPTNSDLYALQNDAGGYSVAGRNLKSTSGWSSYSGAGNGDDTLGFNGLPTGYRNIQKASGSVVAFQNINESTGFWSCTEHQQTASEAYVLILRYSSNWSDYGSQDKKLGYSLRLVRDAE